MSKALKKAEVRPEVVGAEAEPEVVRPKQRDKTPIHMAFAARLNQACENSATIPPANYGRLVHIANALETRFGQKLATETVRKWFAGESKPRDKSLAMLSEVIGVDPAWLALGSAPEVSVKEQRIRNAVADGVVNVVAGLIQMHGGHPSFPDEKDDRARDRGVDIVAIIKGVSYTLHVVLGEREGNSWNFMVPATTVGETTIIGVMPVDDLSVRLVELDVDGMEEIKEAGRSKGGHFKVTMGDDLRTGDHQWRSVPGFRERF